MITLPQAVALSITHRWPSLEDRAHEAVRLVEAGSVRRIGQDMYLVAAMVYTVTATLADGKNVRYVGDGLVTAGRVHSCSCLEARHGEADLVELEPGKLVRPCSHILAVYIARVVEAEAVR